MGIGIGLDIGSTTTKIVARRRDGTILAAKKYESGEPGSETPGVVETFVSHNNISLSSIRGISFTGVGAAKAPREILGIRCLMAEEFYAIAAGGLLLAQKERAIVVSIGTGTAIVKAEKNDAVRFGGSGVGGGTLSGLARHLYGITNFDEIAALSQKGNISRIDLKIADIFQKEYIGLPPEMTCSNFGKMSPDATREDILLGLANMILETAGVMAGLACRGAGMDTVIITGSLATLPQAAPVFKAFTRQTGLHYTIPPHPPFATAIGATQTLWSGNRSARGILGSP